VFPEIGSLTFSNFRTDGHTAIIVTPISSIGVPSGRTMDMSKESLTLARSQRLEDRNLSKEQQKTDSLSDGTDKKYAFATMPTDSQSTTKSTTRTVPDSFAPPAFNGTNGYAVTWLVHFQRYAAYIDSCPMRTLLPSFLCFCAKQPSIGTRL